MTEWSEHVKRYAKKHKMSYRQASMDSKCKEAYQKKKKRMNVPPGRSAKSARSSPFGSPGRGGGSPGRGGGSPGRGEGSPAGKKVHELPYVVQRLILKNLDCSGLDNLRKTNKTYRYLIDSNPRMLMNQLRKRYREYFNRNDPATQQLLQQFNANPSWPIFKQICDRISVFYSRPRRRGAVNLGLDIGPDGQYIDF